MDKRLFQSALLLATVSLTAVGLTACGTGISPNDAATQAQPLAPPPSSGGGMVASAAPPAVPFATAKFSFAPVTGAPASILANMSARLGSEAFAQHVTLVPSGDAQANYVVKGYLSAVGDPSGTILVYVWDVFDSSGKRVHRISGQETSTSGSQDPWAAVDSATISNVARRTIGALVAWGNGSV